MAMSSPGPDRSATENASSPVSGEAISRPDKFPEQLVCGKCGSLLPVNWDGRRPTQKKCPKCKASKESLVWRCASYATDPEGHPERPWADWPVCRHCRGYKKRLEWLRSVGWTGAGEQGKLPLDAAKTKPPRKRSAASIAAQPLPPTEVVNKDPWYQNLVPSHLTRGMARVIARCPQCGMEDSAALNVYRREQAPPSRTHTAGLCPVCLTKMSWWCEVHSEEFGWLNEPVCRHCAESRELPPSSVPHPAANAARWEPPYDSQGHLTPKAERAAVFYDKLVHRTVVGMSDLAPAISLDGEPVPHTPLGHASAAALDDPAHDAPTQVLGVLYSSLPGLAMIAGGRWMWGAVAIFAAIMVLRMLRTWREAATLLCVVLGAVGLMMLWEKDVASTVVLLATGVVGATAGALFRRIALGVAVLAMGYVLIAYVYMAPPPPGDAPTEANVGKDEGAR